MEPVTSKSTTILIGEGEDLQSFRSLEELPGAVRTRLQHALRGTHAATILIADEGGRKQILRALEGGSSGIDSKFLQTLADRHRYHNRRRFLWLDARQWLELGLVAGIGVCLYLLAVWR